MLDNDATRKFKHRNCASLPALFFICDISCRGFVHLIALQLIAPDLDFWFSKALSVSESDLLYMTRAFYCSWAQKAKIWALEVTSSLCLMSSLLVGEPYILPDSSRPYLRCRPASQNWRLSHLEAAAQFIYSSISLLPYSRRVCLLSLVGWSYYLWSKFLFFLILFHILLFTVF